MTIYERFERLDNEDIVMIGEMLENLLASDTGKLLKLMLNNLKTLEIANSRNGIGTSDKVLGRLEAYDTVLADIQAFVDKKKEIQRPIILDPIEHEMAEEQTVSPMMRGGEI